MLRTLLALSVLVLPASFTAGQDMPLTGVLAPAGSWQRLSGITGAQALTFDSRGTVFVTVPAAGRLIAVEPDGQMKLVANVAGVRGIAVRPNGLLYIWQCDTQQLVTVNAAGKESVLARELPAEDIAVSRAGHCCITLPRDKAIYRIEPDGKKVRVADGIAAPAGLAVWRNDSSLVVGDSAGKHLWAFRIEKDGSLMAGEPYYSLWTRPKEASGVRGLATDVAGRVFAATREGVQVFDPTGRLSGVMLSPERSPVTAVAFGGAGLDRLYIVCGGNVYHRRTLTRGLAGAEFHP